MEHVTDILGTKTYQRFGFLVNTKGTDEGIYKIELASAMYSEERILQRLKDRFSETEFDIYPLKYRTISDIANDAAKVQETETLRQRAEAIAKAAQLIEDNA